jgi:hypothetical protein
MLWQYENTLVQVLDIEEVVMKRFTTIILVGAFAVSLLGCSSESSNVPPIVTSSSTSSTVSSQPSNTDSGSPVKSSDINFNSGYGDVGKSNSAQQSQSPDSVTDVKTKATTSVKLVAGWPKEVPLLKGTITGSSLGKAPDKYGRPGSKPQYMTAIETDTDNKAIVAFYKSKFAKVISPGFARSKNGYCAGVIGNWKVYVSSAVAPNDLDIYAVTVAVQPIK